MKNQHCIDHLLDASECHLFRMCVQRVDEYRLHMEVKVEGANYTIAVRYQHDGVPFAVLSDVWELHHHLNGWAEGVMFEQARMAQALREKAHGVVH